MQFYDFCQINKAIADAELGDTIKPVLLISGGKTVEAKGFTLCGTTSRHICRNSQSPLVRLFGNFGEVTGYAGIIGLRLGQEAWVVLSLKGVGLFLIVHSHTGLQTHLFSRYASNGLFKSTRRAFRFSIHSAAK